jgi:hypothetical protein
VVCIGFKGKYFPLLQCLPNLGTKTLVYKTCPQLFQKGLGVSSEESQTTISHNFSHWRFHVLPMEGIKNFTPLFLKEKDEFSKSSQNGVFLRML